MKKLKKLTAILLVVSLIVILVGCSRSDSDADAGKVTASVEPTAYPTIIPSELPQAAETVSTSELTGMLTSTGMPEPTTTPEPTKEPGVFSGLTDKQRDSISMLNYLTVLTQEINSSKNSRLYLESAYSSIVNNTYPNAVDNRTLGELNTILDTLEDYRMIAVKRERLEYIYEQNKAQALRGAIPNPLGLLSAVQSMNMAKLVASIAYMAIDSVSSYQSASSEAEMQYLKDGWVLDDEQAKRLHDQRKDMFNYMVKTVNEHDLPGELALTEETVSDLVKWENDSNITSRIQFLENKQNVYQAYGGYWLILANSYYENGDYAKCLKAIEAYERLGIGIFRRDYDYAEILPLAIVSASAVLGTEDYISRAEKYAENIVTNTADRQWALRYFAAQTYVDLYGRSQDSSYLQKAYDTVLNNVNSLVKEQQSLNEKYLAPVVETKAEAGATKAQQAEISQYNKMLKATRKTELPPIYEPLLMNCELLYSLAAELDISEQEKEKVTNIVHHNGSKLFLSDPVDMMFSFDPSVIATDEVSIAFDGEKLSIPARLVTSSATIKVTITAGENTNEFTDFVIEKVERKSEGDIDLFIAVYTSKSLSKFKYLEGMRIDITIVPYESENVQKLEFVFESAIDEYWWILPDGIKYQRTK